MTLSAQESFVRVLFPPLRPWGVERDGGPGSEEAAGGAVRPGRVVAPRVRREEGRSDAIPGGGSWEPRGLSSPLALGVGL